MNTIVHWVGGKNKIIPQLLPLIPKTFNTYYEPFLGGASMLLALTPEKAVVNDINANLINCYKQLASNTEDFIKGLTELREVYKNKPDTFYYDIRNKFNDKIRNKEYDLEQAIYFLFLNKTCYNGLYRENSKGEFNSPCNGRRVSIFELDNIVDVANYFRKVEFLSTDFSIACENAKCGDFVFVDSPYDEAYTSYSKDSFNLEDHKRLADFLSTLNDKGVKFMLTNNDTKLINELYPSEKFYKHKIITPRCVNPKAKLTANEIVITNYKEND